MENVTIDQSVFQNLLENIPGMLYRCKFQPSWPILYVSKGSFDLTGYFPSELTNGRVDFASLIHPDDREWVWEHFTLQLSKKENCNCEYRIIAKDGKQKWVRE
ncbi:MAG: PAS domain S-box protein, partial [Chitinophagaceae bacterium]